MEERVYIIIFGALMRLPHSATLKYLTPFVCLWNKLIVSTSEQEVSLEPEEALIEVEVEGEGACGLFFGSGEEWDEMQVRVLKGRGVVCIIF